MKMKVHGERGRKREKVGGREEEKAALKKEEVMVEILLF